MSHSIVPPSARVSLTDFVNKVLSDQDFAHILNQVLNAENDSMKDKMIDKLFKHWNVSIDETQEQELRRVLKNLPVVDPAFSHSGSEDGLLGGFSDEDRPEPLG